MSTSETANIRAIRASAASICLNSPLHSAEYGIVSSGSTFAWASATVPARSRPRTSNLIAMNRWPCSR